MIAVLRLPHRLMRRAWCSPADLAQRAQVGGEVAGRGQGVGVVVAQDPPAAGEGVLVELAGRPGTRPARAGRRRGCWRRSGCRGGRRPGPGGGGPGCPGPGRGRPGTRPARAGRRRGCWRRPGCRGGPRPGPAGGGPGCPGPGRGRPGASPSARRSPARLLAEIRVSGWSSPRTRRRRVRVSSFRSRAAWCSPRRTGRWRGCWRRTGCRGGPRPGRGGGGPGCPGPGRGPPGARPARAGRWRGCSARDQGVGVVLAQDPAASGQGVLVQVAGGLLLTQLLQVSGEVAGRDQGVGVVVAQDAAAVGSGCPRPGRGPARSGPVPASAQAR